MTTALRTVHDAGGDVLYVRRADVPVVNSRPGEDDYLILNYDSRGVVVGVQLLAAREMPLDFWKTHPDRNVLPLDILEVLDAWIFRQH